MFAMMDFLLIGVWIYVAGVCCFSLTGVLYLTLDQKWAELRREKLLVKYFLQCSIGWPGLAITVFWEEFAGCSRRTNR